jgi:hypothetical protein
MWEQDGHQKKLFREIKDRMAAIRQRYVKQQHESNTHYFVAETYAQGAFFFVGIFNVYLCVWVLLFKMFIVKCFV